MSNDLRQRWRNFFFLWLDRRAPPARHHRLGRDKLYIFPTAIGFVFLCLIIVLWMLGTNYQNNLILGLCWLLSGLFVLTILRTHGNLSGLEVHWHDADSMFAGQEVAFHLDIRNPGRGGRDGIAIAWQGELPAVVAIDAEELKRVAVCAFAARRGYLRPGRLRVETIFPLGLLRCWTWLNLEASAVVFPEPKNLREPTPHTVEDEGQSAATSGGDDFSGLRNYQVGDPLKQVAWKHYARGKGLMSKEFSRSLSPEAWLTWDSLAGLDTEQRLSTLCHWVLHYEQLGISYGLDIPGSHIEPSSGPPHKRALLTALALYGGN
jgi:uncharacterized protein (DUF58 family)